MSRRRDNPVGNLIQSFADIRSDYSATRPSKFRRNRTGLPAMGSGADYHLRNDTSWLKALEYARDLDRNDSVIGPMLDRATDSTIQDGIDPDPMTGDEKLDAELLARWYDWSEDPEQCDITGEQSFDSMEWNLFRQGFLVDGDMVALLTREGKLQLVEAHRIRKPSNTKQNVVNGVLLDGNRRRLEYWITKEDINPNAPLKNVADVIKVPVRDAEGERVLCHVYHPKRITQTRGVSALWPMLDAAGMFEDINFAAMIKQQISACFAVFHEQALGIDAPGDTQIGDRSTETMGGGGTRTLESITPGMRIIGKPGEKLSGFSPNVPGTDFFPHMKLILTQLSINLGLPLCVAMLDASETNFSGFRGAVDQARLGFRRNQRAIRDKFHRPVYLWKIRDWMQEDGALRRAAERKKIDIYSHNWKFPSWPYIDPYKDATADTVRLKGSHISPRRMQAERGREWRETANEFVEDCALAITLAKQKAAELNQLFPDDPVPVQWRDLINLPTGDGITLKLADPNAPEPNHTDSNPNPSPADAKGTR